MLFTIYLSRLAGPCQRWLAGGGRAAAELPCPGHSHGDTDGDRTPERTAWRARRQEGTSWPGSPGCMSCKPPTKAKPFSFVFLASTGSCFAPCPAPAQRGQTSHSMQPPGGAPPHRPRSKLRARHSGAGPDPRLRFLPRAASCHSPTTLCRSPTPGDSARRPAGPHSRTPTPSSCAVFLLAPSSSRCLGACVGHGLSGDVPVMVLTAMAR